MDSILTKTPVLLLVVTLALAGCDYLPFGFTSIKEITSAPAQFEGKEVKLRGKVKEITKIPLFDLKMYVLQDDSGEITVVSLEPLPKTNEQITIKGVVESAAIISGKSLGLRVREKQRL